MKNTNFYFFVLGCFFAFSSCSEKRDSDFNLDANIINQLDENFYSDEESVKKITIKHNTYTTFTTGYGKLLMIKPNTFIYEDNSVVNEPINFEIREYESIPEMLLNGLQTLSSKGVLETAGMFYTKATVSSGKKIKINPNSPLEIGDRLNLENGELSYELFEGKVKNGQLSWENPKKPSPWGPIPYDAFLNYYYKNWVHGKSHKDSILVNLINDVDLLKYQSSWAASPEYMMRAHDLRFSWFMQYIELKNREDSMRNHLLNLTQFSLEKADQIILQKWLVDSVDFWKYWHYRYGTPDQKRKIKGDSAIHASISNYKKKFINSSYWVSNEIDFVIDTFTIQFIKKKGYFNPVYDDYPEERKAERDRIRDFYYPICAMRNIHPINLGRTSPVKFALSNLGWHNIDRFLEKDLEEQLLKVTCKNEKNVTFYLLLEESSVMLNITSDNGQCEFKEKIPTEKAKVIAINVKNKAIQVGYQNIQIGTNKTVELQLKTISPDDLYDIITKTD